MRRGEGIFAKVAELAEAVLNNGIGNHQAAMALAQRAVEHADTDLVLPAWAAVELVEAAVRSGAMKTAADTVSRLNEMTSASGTDWALGVHARSRALLSDGAEAERWYREAIERLGRTRMRTELARAHLLYGEWLRRERRRTDARMQLRVAHDMFDAMGMQEFAERARRELLATGETARRRTVAASGPQLTPQEAQVARLAAEGLTNPEIGGAPVHQRKDRPVPPEQGVHKGWHPLAQPASSGLAERSSFAGRPRRGPLKPHIVHAVAQLGLSECDGAD